MRTMIVMDKWFSGNHVGLKFPDICLTGEEKPQKNLSQQTYPDRGSNPGPLRNTRACYRLLHSGGHNNAAYQGFSNYGTLYENGTRSKEVKI